MSRTKSETLIGVEGWKPVRSRVSSRAKKNRSLYEFVVWLKSCDRMLTSTRESGGSGLDVVRSMYGYRVAEASVARGGVDDNFEPLRIYLHCWTESPFCRIN